MTYANWCYEQHRKTNHMYDTYLPYQFHLHMVEKVGEDFEHLLDDTVDYFTGKKEYDRSGDTTVTLRTACKRAIPGHDLIEDARLTYNDVKNELGQEAADIIFAVTNEKGKTRKDRANDAYYAGIRTTKGGVFVKLCDRIANVQYSKMTKSRQYEMYKKENEHFMKQLGWGATNDIVVDIDTALTYAPMFNYLNDLFLD